MLEDYLLKAWNAPPGIPPRAMVSQDHAQPNDEAIRIAGQFNQKGDSVPRGFLTVLSDSSPNSLPHTLPAQSSGRLELARWLTAGQGLVRTVDNFGRTGETPSHPLLLDYLAQRLIEHQWSVKHLIREIVLSETFQLSSQHEAHNDSVDPDNVFLWRYNRRRIDPETFRDSILQLAGTLDLNTYMSTVHYLGDQATAVGPNTVRRRTDFPCRSVFLPVIRNDLPEIFEILDFADPQVATGLRRQTIVPTQSLFLLNDEQIMDAATKIAQKSWQQTGATVEDKIRWAYRFILGMDPTAAEQTSLIETYQKLLEQSANDAIEREINSFSIIVHAILASSRFQFYE